MLKTKILLYFDTNNNMHIFIWDSSSYLKLTYCIVICIATRFRFRALIIRIRTQVYRGFKLKTVVVCENGQRFRHESLCLGKRWQFLDKVCNKILHVSYIMFMWPVTCRRCCITKTTKGTTGESIAATGCSCWGATSSTLWWSTTGTKKYVFIFAFLFIASLSSLYHAWSSGHLRLESEIRLNRGFSKLKRHFFSRKNLKSCTATKFWKKNYLWLPRLKVKSISFT